MVKIIKDKNPYVLDAVDDPSRMVALTRKNADFIKAVIRLDSNYGDVSVVQSPSTEFDPENGSSSSNKKNRGSVAYWFGEMKKSNCDFRKCVLGAIIAIDSTNSTHLEAAELIVNGKVSASGRKAMRDIVCEHCKNHSDLVKMLNTPFDADNKNHLISLLSTKTVSKKDGNARYNLSFATKFCSYASLLLGASIDYSRFDNIVSDSLPKYEQIYLKRTVKPKEYKIEYEKTKKMDDDEKYQYRLKIYQKYANTIQDILNALKKDGISLTKDEFDQIVWYTQK